MDKVKETEDFNKAMADMLVSMVGKTLLDTYRWFVELRIYGGITRDIASRYIKDLTKLNESFRKSTRKEFQL